MISFVISCVYFFSNFWTLIIFFFSLVVFFDYLRSLIVLFLTLNNMRLLLIFTSPFLELGGLFLFASAFLDVFPFSVRFAGLFNVFLISDFLFFLLPPTPLAQPEEAVVFGVDEVGATTFDFVGHAEGFGHAVEVNGAPASSQANLVGVEEELGQDLIGEDRFGIHA